MDSQLLSCHVWGLTGPSLSSHGPHWTLSLLSWASLDPLSPLMGLTGPSLSSRGPHWTLSLLSWASLDPLSPLVGLTGPSLSSRGPILHAYRHALGVSGQGSGHMWWSLVRHIGKWEQNSESHGFIQLHGSVSVCTTSVGSCSSASLLYPMQDLILYTAGILWRVPTVWHVSNWRRPQACKLTGMTMNLIKTNHLGQHASFGVYCIKTSACI